MKENVSYLNYFQKLSHTFNLKMMIVIFKCSMLSYKVTPSCALCRLTTLNKATRPTPNQY